MSTGEALAALIHHVLISCARQVMMGLPIGEATVEEVWAWPARNKRGLNVDRSPTQTPPQLLFLENPTIDMAPPIHPL